MHRLPTILASLLGLGLMVWILSPRAEDKAGRRDAATTASPDLAEYKKIDWQLLQKLDYKTGQGPADVMSLDNSHIRLPGFVVPLSDSYSEITEFLLVPDPQSCVHVPPPPPNLIVHVKMDHALRSEQLFNPSWVSGIMKIERTDSAYGYASYRLHGSAVEKYTY